MRILTTLAIVLVPLVLATIKHRTTVWVLRSRSDELPTGPRPTRGQWALLGVSGIATGVFWYLMQIDQLHGGNEVWPVEAFAGAFIFYGLVWIAIMTRRWPSDGAA